MKLLRRTLFASIVALFATGAFAQTSVRGPVARIHSAPRIAAAQAPTATYSTEIPLVQRFAPADGGNSTTLVLDAAHSFNVTLSARDQRTNNTGPGIALPQNDLFGYFSIPALTGNGSNPEVFVKILDGRTINQSFWVFYGHLTDLQYDLTVTENATGRVKTYHKAAGQQPGGFDTTAFPNASATTRETQSVRSIQAIDAAPNSFVRTAVDISNHTSAQITADLQYNYTCTSPGCSPANRFYNSPVRRINLGPFGNFHQDDVVDYLSTQSALQPGAEEGSNGTLLVTFNGLPSNVGWEATAQASVYNRILEPDALRGTVGFGMNGSLFFESTNTSLTSTVRDTVPSPGLEGALVTNVGIRNTDIGGTNGNVNVDLTLYDPTTGNRVGNTLQVNNIAPGEVRLINDLYTQAGIPAATVGSLILFADVRNATANSPTIEGFVLIEDSFSGDSRFHEMKCADPVSCGG